MDITLSTLATYIIYALWIGLALYIAIVDYKTRLISVLHLLVFAVLGLSVAIIQEKTLQDSVFIISLPLIIFGLGHLSKSMIIGGADWIFFPAFLIFYEWEQSVMVFMVSIFIMTVISQLKKKEGVLFETPFITILVASGIVMQGVLYV